MADGDSQRHTIEHMLYGSNPIFDGEKQTLPEVYGTVSSEPECCCPAMGISATCSRHNFQMDWIGQNPFKDHLAEYVNCSCDDRVPGMYSGTIDPNCMFHGDKGRAFRRNLSYVPPLLRDTLAAQYATLTASPMFGMPVYEDALLSYQQYAPPRPTPPPGGWPKPSWRTRFRIKRHNLNHAVQQWIHDHLQEAYCDQ